MPPPTEVPLGTPGMFVDGHAVWRVPPVRQGSCHGCAFSDAANARACWRVTGAEFIEAGSSCRDTDHVHGPHDHVAIFIPADERGFAAYIANKLEG